MKDIKSKEAILDKHLNVDVNKDQYPNGYPYITEAMSEYAKQQSLFFQEYLSRYKTEDYVRTMRMYKEAGGMVTHRGYNIEDVYNDFAELKPIPSESMEGIVYYFHTGKETNNLQSKQK